jgi:hypothetical protein
MQALRTQEVRYVELAGQSRSEGEHRARAREVPDQRTLQIYCQKPLNRTIYTGAIWV